MSPVRFRTPMRAVIIYGGVWHRREMFFLVKILLIQPLKSQHFSLPNLKYQLKDKYPPLVKNSTKGYHLVVTHVLYHFCDMSLITFLQCKVSCCLHMCFGDTICLLTNRKMVKTVTLIDLHIELFRHVTVDIAF
jgi:hypothetical protein